MDLNRVALLVVLKYVPVNSKILVAGERCNVTGEYFERGSMSE